MYSAKKIKLNQGVLRMGVQWMVVVKNFDGVERTFGYFLNQTTAELVAEAMNDKAAVSIVA